MPFSTCPTIGLIAVDPTSGPGAARWLPATDDSSVETLLASLAQLPALGDTDEVLVASTRWTCSRVSDEQADAAIRVDLAQLLADLEAEYAAVAHRLSC
jgi:hypothetical protein